MIRNLRLISKVITASIENLIITTHKFPNISRGKANQTMKFSQLIEHNMRNNFNKKLCTKYGGETSHKLFSKKQNCIQFVFMLCPSRGLPKYIETKLLTSGFYLIIRFSRNKKKSWDSVSCSFSAWFWKKTILTIYSVNWLNFIFWFSLLLNILGNMCIVTCKFLFPT